MMEEYWATGLKVMDYSSPSDGTPISSHVRLNHIGLYDGLLHMQFALDNQPVLVNDRNHTPVADIHMIYTAPADVNPPEWARRLEWDTDGQYWEDFVEYIIPYDPESGIRANLKELVVQELEEVVQDKWEIKVPLRDVLAEDAGLPAKSAQPEANLNYRTLIDTVDRDLVDAMVPVNLSYEESGIRLNVLQAAVRENEALLVYSKAAGSMNIQKMRCTRSSLAIPVVIPSWLNMMKPVTGAFSASTSSIRTWHPAWMVPFSRCVYRT